MGRVARRRDLGRVKDVDGPTGLAQRSASGTTGTTRTAPGRGAWSPVGACAARIAGATARAGTIFWKWWRSAPGAALSPGRAIRAAAAIASRKSRPNATCRAERSHDITADGDRRDAPAIGGAQRCIVREVDEVRLPERRDENAVAIEDAGVEVVDDDGAGLAWQVDGLLCLRGRRRRHAQQQQGRSQRSPSQQDVAIGGRAPSHSHMLRMRLACLGLPNTGSGRNTIRPDTEHLIPPFQFR